MKGWVNTKIFILILSLGLALSVQAQKDQDAPMDMQEQMMMLQKQMEQMMQGLNQEGGASSFFFSDTIFKDLSNIPLDSMMQGLSFAFPGMESDSIALKGLDGSGGMFGPGFQQQLEQMFESLDDVGPEYFMDMEELKRQLEQNGIRPDDLELTPQKPGQKKKKVYKI